MGAADLACRITCCWVDLSEERTNKPRRVGLFSIKTQYFYLKQSNQFYALNILPVQEVQVSNLILAIRDKAFKEFSNS